MISHKCKCRSPNELHLYIASIYWAISVHRCCTMVTYWTHTLKSIGAARIFCRGGQKSRRRVASAECARSRRRRWREGRGLGRGIPLPSRLEGLGSVVSSPSGVRSVAPAKRGFWHILGSETASGTKIIAIIAYINCLYWDIVNIKKCPFNQFPTTENSFKNPLIRTLAFIKTKPNNYLQPTDHKVSRCNMWLHNCNCHIVVRHQLSVTENMQQ